MDISFPSCHCQQSCRERSGFVSPSSFHDERLMGPSSCRSCEFTSAVACYVLKMSVSNKHLFLLGLSFFLVLLPRCFLPLARCNINGPFRAKYSMVPYLRLFGYFQVLTFTAGYLLQWEASLTVFEHSSNVWIQASILQSDSSRVPLGSLIFSAASSDQI